MEPHAVELGDGRQISYGLSAGKTCAAWAGETEIVAETRWLAYANDQCSCGIEALRK